MFSSIKLCDFIIKELLRLRDELFESLSSVQVEITNRKISSTPISTPISVNRKADKDEISVIRPVSDSVQPPKHELNKNVKLALGLLLKHRGGPGFGHGRLEGRELAMLEENLRSVSTVLLKESLDAQ